MSNTFAVRFASSEQTFRVTFNGSQVINFGIFDAYVDENGHLILESVNGQTLDAGSVVGSTENYLSVQAGEAIGGHRLVALDTAGKAVYTTDYKTIVGMTINAADTDDPVGVVVAGPVTEPSWSWTPGEPLFAAANGLMTQTPPTTGTLLQVGVATSETSIFVKIGDPTILN